MISTKKQQSALKALHQLIITARFMAYQNEPAARIAKVLDYAEILPTLISAVEDRTDEFRTHLEGFASEFPAGSGILMEFDKG